ncbi:MAG: DUF1465 family protein [Pseudomonadota bacterium]
MANIVTKEGLTRKLVDSLYVEAMVLADEARAYFEDEGVAARDSLPPSRRVGYAVESLKVTTRLMHVIAWLLTWRGEASGEIDAAAASHPDRRLGLTMGSDAETVETLPEEAQRLIAGSEELYKRVHRLEKDLLSPPEEPKASPARSLLGRLERAF